MGASSDTALVSAAVAGDEQAYGSLFAQYENRIYNYAYGIAGNPDDARDITQDAFLKVFEALPRLTENVNFSAYLYRTTHNLAIDAVKAHARFAPPDALDLQSEPALPVNPERMALLREQQTVVHEAAFELPESQRAVLTLRELHEMSYQEIADVLEMPRNTVGVVLSRARLKFKEVFRMSAIDAKDIAKECEGMLPLLSAYIDDELGEEELARVESHLEECAFCTLALEEMREASESYRGIIPLLPPASIEDGVLSGVHELLQAEKAAAAELESAPSAGEMHAASPTLEFEAVPAGRSPRRRRMSKAAVVAAIVVVLVVITAGTFWALGPGSDRTGEPLLLDVVGDTDAESDTDPLVDPPVPTEPGAATGEMVPAERPTEQRYEAEEPEYGEEPASEGESESAPPPEWPPSPPPSDPGSASVIYPEEIETDPPY